MRRVGSRSRVVWAGGGAGWETWGVEENRPGGGKTLGLILLAMVVILAVLIGLAVWASPR
ncbi:hypothetical protein GCM10009560_77990 [Nonomuraea longicatena]|uniref:Uncharacterized protein n=1 Tax=Nonomuraea longicatena TaxID=83682 RepID=A0ABN1RAY4_9ACTN